MAHGWIADGEGHLAQRLAIELLRLPAVRADAQLNDEVVSLLERLDDAGTLVRLREAPTDPLMAAAREQWYSHRPAA